MKKSVLFLSLLALGLSACGQPQMMMPPNPMMMQQRMAPMNAMTHMRAANDLQAQLTLSRPKEESPIIERNVPVERSPFDDIADSQRNRPYANDPLYSMVSAAQRNPFDGSFELPFHTFNDFRDHVRYGHNTPHEDYKYMDVDYARSHFNRYINSAFTEVQRLYKADREQMKRFIMLDVLVNSLVVDRDRLPYEDVHNPPAERHYKLFPTEAAAVMPTFGEIVAHNRNSYEVNYVRWDMYRAARYYQANYRRIFGLVMEHGPNKRDAWRLVHREISAYAGR